MEFSYKRVVIRRFFELLITNLLLSIFIITVNVVGILATKTELSFGLVTGTVVFLYINVRMLRNCYFDLDGKLEYYTSNAIAYLLFAVLNVLSYFFVADEIYTWFFALTKFIVYTNYEISSFISLCLFHIVGIISILLSPIGMKGFIYEKLVYEQIGEDV